MADIIFMGTPHFAVPTLEALARDHRVLAVFTQPDKPAGRGRSIASSPVKQWADAHHLAIHQPASLRKDTSIAEAIRDLKPEVIIVAAYGLILPKAILDIPAKGCLNIHASLLPKHRGAAPIAAAILSGDSETGVTIMRMDEGLDTGPMLAMAREPIRSDDTTQSLSDRLSSLGARLMSDTLPKYLRGEIDPQPQPIEGVSYSPKISKDDALIDWRKSAIEIDRMVRAYTLWPGAHTFWNGSMLKVLKVGVNSKLQVASLPAGQVVKLSDGAIGVATGSGVIVLKEIQLAGRKAMTAEEFARGQPGLINYQFTMYN